MGSTNPRLKTLWTIAGAVFVIAIVIGVAILYPVNKPMTSTSQTTSASGTTSTTGQSTSSTTEQSKTSATSTPTVSPIKHVIFMIQENHAFDNMFGTFPGLPSQLALSPSTCMPQPSGPCVAPFNADNQPIIQQTDICHTSTCAHLAYDNGRMDGFGLAVSTNLSRYPMAYYDGQAIPYYWDYAQYYTLNDLFMSSALSFSLPNHLYTVAAQGGITDKCSGICQTPYNLTFADIGTELTQHGISWAYYQYNWNDSLDCNGVVPWTAAYVSSHVHGTGSGGGYDGFWSGEADFVKVQQTPGECQGLQNYNDLSSAITSNGLPSVSWIIPAPGVSEHPQQSTWLQGEKYTSSIINAIEKSPAWNSTVIYLTWDDYGGYYDNVVPTQIDHYGMGMRVPLIAISPYSKQGQIVNGPSYGYSGGQTSQEDFSSFLATIEYNWNLQPLTQRDAEQPNLFYMLDFHQSPLPPLYLGSSGVVYPYQTCVSNGACSTTTPTGFALNLPTGPMLSEPLGQALAESGDGDPGD